MSLASKLDELSDARASYKDFVRAVDQDLQAERFKRLAGEQGRIRALVIEAYMGGATIADLKRAYDTKDYRTIKNILDSASAEIEARRQEELNRQESWWDYDSAQREITIWSDDRSESATFQVVPLEEGYLLDVHHPLDVGTGGNAVTRKWDGAILEPSTGDERAGELYSALAGGE